MQSTVSKLKKEEQELRNKLENAEKTIKENEERVRRYSIKYHFV